MSLSVAGVDKAFRSVEEDTTSSIQERFDILGQEIISNSYFIMERQRKTGQRISDEERDLQEDMVEQFNIIEKIFIKLKKAGRLGDVKPNDKFDEQLLSRIKSKKSTIGDIVQTLPTAPKNE